MLEGGKGSTKQSDGILCAALFSVIASTIGNQGALSSTSPERERERREARHPDVMRGIFVMRSVLVDAVNAN